MSIVPLYKATLFGMVDDKAAALEQIQALGCLHLVPLIPERRETERVISSQPVEAYKALRYLGNTRHKRRQVHKDDNFNMQVVVQEVRANQLHIREAEDKRDALQERIRELKPWGNFNYIPPELLNGLRLWFYILPAGLLPSMQKSPLTWQVVQKNNRFAYLVVIAEEEPAAGAMPVPRTHTGSIPLDEVTRLLEETEIELEGLMAQREALTRWIYLLASHLSAAEDYAALLHASNQTLDNDAIFACQGWLPAPEQERLQDFAVQQGLALLIEQPTAKDHPPTLLTNPPELAAGQDLVAFYQTPGYRSWDPSLVVFFSFTLFFSMILSDAGYATLLGLGVLAGWRAMGRSDGGRRLRVLLTVLCGSAMLWGVLVGSYFGVSPTPGSTLATLKIMDINDFESMMRLSVGIGVFHIALANGIMAWRNYGNKQAWVCIGWIAAVVGGFISWLAMSMGSGIMSYIGEGIIGAGLITVFVFASERSIHKPLDLLMWVLDGLAALTNITKLFGDVLSYLRLFALGLASASLALTFNDLARQVAQENPGLGLLLSLLILLVGHLLNILLSLMSGVVHGLRLNFIEFYNWGLSDEGYPFRAFSKKGVKE
jgi:V/A-type H+/Na+-transporting ATPase subunit I